MAKQPRTKLSGKEACYVLKQNNISLFRFSKCGFSVFRKPKYGSNRKEGATAPSKIPITKKPKTNKYVKNFLLISFYVPSRRIDKTRY